MADQTPSYKRENRENDFLDMTLGTAGAIIFFMGIAFIAMIVEILM